MRMLIYTCSILVVNISLAYVTSNIRMFTHHVCIEFLNYVVTGKSTSLGDYPISPAVILLVAVFVMVSEFIKQRYM